MSTESELSFDDFDMDIASTNDPRLGEEDIQLKNTVHTQPVTEFFKEVISKLSRNNDRIKIIIENVTNSKLLEQSAETKVFQGYLANINRDTQTELSHTIGSLLDFYKELSSKPKGIENYTIQYSSERNKYLSSLSSDRERLEQVFSWEMDKKVEEVIQEIKKISTRIFTFLSELSEKKVLKGTTKKQELLFEDSKSICLIIFDELEEIRKKIDERIIFSE